MNLALKLAAAAALAAAFAPAAALAASKAFDLGPFTQIEISSGIDAIVTVGGTQSITAESPRQEEIDELIVEVKDGKLHAYRDWSIFDIFSFGERQTKLTIAVPALSSVSADSGSDVDVTGITGDAVTLRSSSGADLNIKAATAKHYDADVSSGAGLDIDGTCESAKLNASSGADLNAEKLLCADVDANASSGSDLEAYASVSIKANASSGSDLKVHGKPPTVQQDASSGADISID
jgi:hypothetical protein